MMTSEDRTMHEEPSTTAPVGQAEKYDFYRLDLTQMAGWSDAAKEQYIEALGRLHRVHLEARLLESVIKCREHIVNRLRGRNE